MISPQMRKGVFMVLLRNASRAIPKTLLTRLTYTAFVLCACFFSVSVFGQTGSYRARATGNWSNVVAGAGTWEYSTNTTNGTDGTWANVTTASAQGYPGANGVPAAVYIPNT